MSTLKDFMEAMKNASTEKTKAYDTTATVTRIEGSTAWVHIPGGVDETPVKMTINASEGDIVQVRVGGGTAFIIGNGTHPPTNDARANEVAYIAQPSVDYVKELLNKNVTVNSITAASGYIEDLTSKNITADSLVADHADVGSLKANKADIDLANVDVAWIEQGNIKKAEVFDENVFDLSGNRATLSRIDASKINVANLRADNLVVRRINGQPVVGGYTLIDSNSSGYASKNPQALGWYEFVNAQWVLSTDTTVDMTKAYYQTGNEVSLYDQAYIDGLENDLQQQIDGAVETFTGSAVPTLVNWPYTDWYDTSVTPVHDERAKHVGDIYYVVNSASDENGYCYRFAYDNTSHAYSWVLIKDSDVTKALSDISELQTFESTTTSWIEETDEGLETIRTNYTALSGRVDDVEDTANAALPASTFESFESTTFTDLVDEVDEQSTTMTNMTTRLGLNSDGTGASTDIVAKESALEQTVDGISTRVGKTETKLIGMYATSSTAESARDKVATITPALPSGAVWELGTGTMVTVKFVNANTYEATSSNPLRLNVNGKGLKPIKTYANGNLSEAEYKWAAGSTFTFVYNGTNWLMQDSSVSVRMNSAETGITQNAEAITLEASKREASVNLLLDSDAPSLDKVYASENRYWSDASVTAITPSIVEISDPPVQGIAHAARFVCDGTNTSDAQRAHAFYNTNDNIIPLIAGQTYTVTWWARCASGSGKTRCNISGKGGTDVFGSPVYDLTSEWEMFSFTATIAELNTNFNRIWFYSRFPANTAGTVEICGCKLIAGDSAENVRSYAESEFAITAEGIASKVSKDGVISSINQSAESVQIQASKVEIDGTAIFNAISDDVDDAITDKGYQTASDVSNAIAGKADKTNALGSVTTKDQYYLSTSSSSATDGSWQDTVPTWSSGKYIWTRVATTKTPVSGTATTTYSTAVYDSALTSALSTASSAQTTANGAASTVVTTKQYYLSTSASSATGGSWGDSVPTWASGKYIWVRFKIVKTPMSGTATTSYTPSESGTYDSALTTALSTANTANAGLANKADKSAAIAEEQRIYYRSSVSTKPNGNGLPTAWVTETGDKYNTNATTSTGWSRKVTPIANGTGASVTKYLYLWTCIQKKTVSGTVTYGDILLDDSTTVIDGGTIVTGTVNANAVNASSGTFDTANIPNLDASKITAGDIAADRMKANSITAINSLTAGKIDADRLDVGSITVGDLSDGPSYSTTAQMNSAIGTAVDGIEIGGRNLLKGTSDITVVAYAKATDEYGLYYKSGTGTLTSHVFEANSLPFPVPTGTCLKVTTTEANTYVGISQKKQVKKTAYCYSAWVKGTAGDTVRLGSIYSGTSGIAENQIYTNFTIADSDWHKYEITFTPQYDHIGDADCRAPYVQVKSATVGRNFYVCGLQLEYGSKATDWTPAPEDDGGGANLVPYPYYRSYASGNPWTENGITWTENADGSVTATGTATADTVFIFTGTNNTANPNGIYCMPAGGYVLSGSPVNGTGSTARLIALFKSDTTNPGTSATDVAGNSSETTTGGYCKSFRLESPTYVRIYAQILSGTTCPEGGYTFYPMLEKGSVVHSFVSPNMNGGAASTATKFITKINDAGIFISPANQNPTTSAAGNSTKITADGMTVYKGGADVSFFGDSVRIGKSNNNRVEIGSTASDAYVNVYSPNTNGGLYCNQNIYAEKNVSAGASVVADTAVHSKGSLTVDGASVFNGSSNELKGTTSFFKGVNIYQVASDPTIGVFCSQPVTVENNLYCQHLDMPNHSALRAKDTGGTLRNLTYLDNQNRYIYGNTTYPTRIYGQTLWMSSQPTYGSDKRLKRNIKELSSDSDELMLNIKPVQYEWDDSYDGYSKGINLGFIAQDVEAQMKSLGMSPDAYHLIQQPQSGDAYYSLSYTEFIPMLTHLVQSQQKEIDLLKEEIRQLKSEV